MYNRNIIICMFQQDVMATRRHRVGRVAHSRSAGVAGGHFATRQPAGRLGEAWPIEAQHLSILPIPHLQQAASSIKQPSPSRFQHTSHSQKSSRNITNCLK